MWSRLGAQIAEEMLSAVRGQIPLPASEHDLRQMIDGQQVIAGIVVPCTVTGDRLGGRTASPQVLLDGRRANAAKITLGYLSTIAAGVVATMKERTPKQIAAVRQWFNPDLAHRWFVGPSLAGTPVMFIALPVTSLSVARAWR